VIGVGPGSDEEGRQLSRAKRDAYLSGAASILVGCTGLMLVGLYLFGVYTQRVSALVRGHVTADLFLSSVLVVLMGARR